VGWATVALCGGGGPAASTAAIRGGFGRRGALRRWRRWPDRVNCGD